MSVSYNLVRAQRKTLSIKIENNEVYVYAPLRASNKIIDDMVKKHEKWILAKLSNPQIMINFDLTKDSFVYILGKRYEVQLVISNKNEVIIKNSSITLTGKSISSIDRMFRKYLVSIVDERAKLLLKKFNYVCEVKYKLYLSKWGCCYSTRNLIILNYLLACTPIECIDEVICHELTHFKVNNHQKNFYFELSKICPDYGKAVKMLKQYSL